MPRVRGLQAADGVGRVGLHELAGPGRDPGPARRRVRRQAGVDRGCRRARTRAGAVDAARDLAWWRDERDDRLARSELHLRIERPARPVRVPAERRRMGYVRLAPLLDAA